MKTTKTSKTKKQVTATPVVVKIQTPEEIMLDTVKSLTRYRDHAKYNVARQLAMAIQMMKGYLETAEKELARMDKDDYTTPDTVTRDIVSQFAWGQANSTSSIKTAMTYLNSYTTYKNQLETLIKYVPMAKEANNQLIAEQLLKDEQARLELEKKAEEKLLETQEKLLENHLDQAIEQAETNS